MRLGESERPEGMKEFFDKRAQGYDQHMAESIDGFEDFYAAVAQPIPSTRAALEILDLGCGTGLELSWILQRAANARITGFDISREMLGHLQEKYADHLGQISLVQASYLYLPFGVSRYDYAVSVMTLHHLTPNTKRDLYARIRESLKTGGKYVEGDFVVLEKSAERGLTTNAEIRDHPSGEGEGGYHVDIPSTTEMLQSLLRKAGFSHTKVLWQRGDAAVYLAEK